MEDMQTNFSEIYFTLLIQHKNGFLMSIFCSAEDKEDKDFLVFFWMTTHFLAFICYWDEYKVKIIYFFNLIFIKHEMLFFNKLQKLK